LLLQAHAAGVKQTDLFSAKLSAHIFLNNPVKAVYNEEKVWDVAFWSCSNIARARWYKSIKWVALLGCSQHLKTDADFLS